MSPAKPTRLPSRVALLPLALLPLMLLAACAHQPRQAKSNVTQVPLSPALPAPAAHSDTAVAAADSSASAAPGTATPGDTATPGSTPVNTGTDTSNATTADNLPGPPADSVVTAKPTDLFDRLRSGFMLQDVDQPAIDSQLNWFANHPDFLGRTFSRSELWLYYIVGQLEQRNMPRELALLPVIESAFEPYAYSRARAAGLWQFISDTGRRFGLKQDWWYDGRRDPIEATRAALDYLQALHDEFNGDWLLAIAAYNCGELMVTRAIERNQRLGRPTDFWHLKLPRETRGYVPELLAMRRLVANPARYGLQFSRIPDEPYFVQVATGGQIDLKVVADIAGISIDDLYELNPAFHRWATDPTGPFRLLIPTDSAGGLEQTLAQLTPDQRMQVGHYVVHGRDTVSTIARHFDTTPAVIRELNDLSASDRPVIDTDLRVPSRDIQLPEKVERAALLADTPARRLRRVHRTRIQIVHRGDTLYSLAQHLGTDVHTLAQLNGLSPDEQLRTGERLRVGARASASAAPHARQARTRQIAGHAGVLASSASSDNGRRMNYVVRRGDTLYGIARLLQVTVHDLIAWNDMNSAARSLQPGQILVAFVKSRG